MILKEQKQSLAHAPLYISVEPTFSFSLHFKRADPYITFINVCGVWEFICQIFIYYYYNTRTPHTATTHTYISTFTQNIDGLVLKLFWFMPGYAKHVVSMLYMFKLQCVSVVVRGSALKCLCANTVCMRCRDMCLVCMQWHHLLPQLLQHVLVFCQSTSLP